MSRFRKWAFWRRLEYGSYVSLILLLISGGVYLNYFYSPSSCFDGQKNNDELAVDCGGSCVRICSFSVTPPAKLWAESFKVFPDQYNAVAYVENKNAIAATPELRYTFSLFDENDQRIAERSNSTILPPNSVYPIFEGRIKTDGREVVRTEIDIEEPELWLPATIGRNQFVTKDFNLIGADLQPRLNVTMNNTTLEEALDVEVVATIFDANGTPLTASQTFVDIFAPRSDEDLVFTWPIPIAKTVRSCVVPTDVAIVIDLSGSMNNDGEIPPQPITSVLAAASEFVSKIGTKDQASIITFASDAEVVTPLTSNIDLITQTVRGLSIDPTEEAGTTNTGAALRLVRSELNSSRHNDNARKVAVLLTDGLATSPEPDPETFALDEAIGVRGEQIEVYAIGLGSEVNLSFLEQIAENPDNAYVAPTAEDLSDIYNEITSAICEQGAARIDIIPKTDTSFTPLR